DRVVGDADRPPGWGHPGPGGPEAGAARNGRPADEGVVRRGDEGVPRGPTGPRRRAAARGSESRPGPLPAGHPPRPAQGPGPPPRGTGPGPPPTPPPAPPPASPDGRPWPWSTSRRRWPCAASSTLPIASPVGTPTWPVASTTSVTPCATSAAPALPWNTSMKR